MSALAVVICAWLVIHSFVPVVESPAVMLLCFVCFFFQAEDGIRDLVRSRGLGDVYKRQIDCPEAALADELDDAIAVVECRSHVESHTTSPCACLLYTSDAADERSSVDLGGRRIIKKKKRGT